ncbi:MAG: phosphotransferase [Campylobacterota bacterium]|nr:phosphotransferase [Campylobacterota bacterium]
MGIKTTVTKKQLPKKYQKYNLIETKDGISDSVYLLDDIYVLKLFENQTEQQILSEEILLKDLKDLLVPKVVDILKIEDKYTIIYTQIDGISIKNTDLDHIKQIGYFLKELHNKTYNMNSININLFEKERLKELIINSKNKIFLDYFNSIKIELKNDGLIHGDIFPDNVKFRSNILSGVYDFSEACEGDFLFDLAVVAVSWCFDKEMLNNSKLDILLNSYGLDIDKVDFIEYMRYAILYYAVTRYINNHNYKELIEKLEYILM